MKKVRSFLKNFIFVELGAFVGKFFAEYLHYKRYPAFYAAMSAPWYTRLIFSAVMTSIIVGITLVVYLILGHCIKKKDSDAESVTFEEEE